MAASVRVMPSVAQASPDLVSYLQAPAPALAPSVAEVPTTGETEKQSRSDLWVVLLGFAIVFVAWQVAVHWIKDPAFPPAGDQTPVEGLTIFAVFFVAAQALERLLEPISGFFWPDVKENFSAKLATATEKVASAFAAAKELQDADTSAQSAAQTKFDSAKAAATDALKEAADAKAEASRTSGNKGVLFWVFATSLAIITASFLKLYLLRTVGVAEPPRAVELLATGLIIGAGTKPLHDLVETLKQKKEAAQAANPQTGTGTAGAA